VNESYGVVKAANDICEREMSASEIVKEIRKELAETISCLSNIETCLTGCGGERGAVDEPKCLRDELCLVERMATDCIGLSHRIHEILFRPA